MDRAELTTISIMRVWLQRVRGSNSGRAKAHPTDDRTGVLCLRYRQRLIRAQAMELLHAAGRLMTIESVRGARRSLGKIYYGWAIVIACNLISCITWGVAIFNQGVFVAYYVSAYNWSPVLLSIGPVLFHLWAGFVGIVVGRMVDRYGPRLVLLAGAFFVCLSTIGFGLVREVWHTYPAFIMLGTGFACIHTVTLGKIVARWFVRQRNRAMAAATFGAGIGGALLVPLNAYMIETYGLLSGGISLAVITLIVIVPCVVWVVRDGPETLGLKPDGDEAVVDDNAETLDSSSGDTQDWTVGHAMRTTAFWGLSICFGLGMVAQSAFLFHQVSFLQNTLGLVGAAFVVTITTLSGIVGRCVFILVGSRMSPKQWAVIVFAMQASSFVVLALATNATHMTIGSVLFGLTMGVIVTLQPLLTAHCFGRVSFGRIYGLVYMSIRVGSALGPVLVGGLLALLGNYFAAWIALALSLAVALVLIPVAINRPVATSFRGNASS
jgi:MFS family permease